MQSMAKVYEENVAMASGKAQWQIGLQTASLIELAAVAAAASCGCDRSAAAVRWWWWWWWRQQQQQRFDVVAVVFLLASLCKPQHTHSQDMQDIHTHTHARSLAHITLTLTQHKTYIVSVIPRRPLFLRPLCPTSSPFVTYTQRNAE